jgi:hypothetical protein
MSFVKLCFLNIALTLLIFLNVSTAKFNFEFAFVSKVMGGNFQNYVRSNYFNLPKQGTIIAKTFC